MGRIAFVVLCALTFSAGGVQAQGRTEPSKLTRKALTPEEERLQKFWHDYYDALKLYYQDLDQIDWVAYYKQHGYQLQACPNCPRTGNSPPVFVSPTMQWVVPGPGMTAPRNGRTPPVKEKP